MEKLFIPKKLKVGYQTRTDTYTGRLAYVIYIDEKGVLRKEASWRKWAWTEDQYEMKWGPKGYEKTNKILHKALPVDDFDNVPTEGFVLNRDGGGGRGWDARNAFIRIYDPRNFEFEISIENLLFIFRYCGLVPGKGLTGEFVFAWQGTELILLPVGCQEYINSAEFTDLKSLALTKDDLFEGLMYYTKKQEKVIYLGKHPYIRNDYGGRHYANDHLFHFLDKPKNHYDYDYDDNGKRTESTKLIVKALKITDLAKVLDTNVYVDYAALFEQVQKDGTLLSTELEFKLNPAKLKFSDRYYNDSYINGHYWLEQKPGQWFCYVVKAYGQGGGHSYQTTPVQKCTMSKIGEMIYDANKPQIKVLASPGKPSKEYTKAEIDAMDFHKLTIQMPKWKQPKDLFLK